MRKIIPLIFAVFITLKLQAQLVTTVAGQPEIAGATDGAPFDATFNNPHGIAIGEDGIVYVSDRWSHTIRRIALDGTVSTLVGQPGVSGDTDGDSSTALFYEPWGLCVGPEGNVFVADTRNNKIRKVTPGGVVSTVAGSGNFGTSSGMGSSATFGNPTGIECDEFGTIYVADHLTHIIRKIDTLGFVSNLAGKSYQMGDADGLGDQASFRRPYGLTLDLEGNILVADEWNHKIRKITPAGVVSTIAGTGLVGADNGLALSAGFNYPWDVSVDSLGNIFVADGYNYLVRKITEGGQVSTYAGTLEVTGAADGEGTNATFSGATAIAFSPVTKELYVGDAYNNLVRKITDLDQGVAIGMISGNSVICEGEFISINASPNIYDTYHFYNNNQVVQSGSNPIFETNQLTPGFHTIQVLATDNSGTSISNEITIQVIEPMVPSISVVGSTSIFAGDSVILIASFGTDYFWSTGESTPTITVFESGSYTVEVEDQNGCMGISEPTEIVVQNNPDAAIITIQGETTICENESSILLSSDPENNQWLKDGWPINGAIANSYLVNTSGIYQTQVTHPSGIITISDPITITVLPAFEIDFTVSETEGTTDDVFSFTISNSNISAASWDFGDGNTSTDLITEHQFDQEGIYSVELIATNENGCKDSLLLSDLILIENDTIETPGNGNPVVNPNVLDEIFIPTAFTPNEDGENDILFVRGQNIQELSFIVYNQWGEMVFQSFSPAYGWDGKVDNQDAQIGNYVFLAEFTTSEGKRKQLSGHVSLLR